MDLTVSDWMKQARITLPCALAWRAMTELVRRHHGSWEISLEQFHPGASVRGVYALWLRNGPGGQSPVQITFNLGGPSGTWATGSPETSGNLTDLLLPDPSRAVDQIQQAARLPAAPSPVPPSTKQVLGMRLVSGVLESLVFRRTPWRASLGAYGHNGGTTIADWVRHVGMEGISRSPDAAQLGRLSDCVLIHPSPTGDPAMVEGRLKDAALMIDLGSGVIGRLDHMGWKKIHQLQVSTGNSADSMQMAAAKLVEQLG